MSRRPSRTRSETTGLYGVLGRDIGYSLSPYIFHSVFQSLGWRAEFARLDLDEREVPNLLAAMRGSPIRGLSVTRPYKERVIAYLDRLDESAVITGAVNTIAKTRGRLIGYNTDVEGVAAALKPFRTRLRDRHAVIFGAGGAARAVVYSLLHRFGMRTVTIAARRPQQARELIHGLQDRMPPARMASGAFRPGRDVSETLQDAALIVNATPVGSHGSAAKRILPVGTKLNRSTLAFDLVYRPIPTLFTLEAKQAGCRDAIDGWTMLVAQAETAFSIWTGRRFPAKVRAGLIRREQAA